MSKNKNKMFSWLVMLFWSKCVGGHEFIEDCCDWSKKFSIYWVIPVLSSIKQNTKNTFWAFDHWFSQDHMKTQGCSEEESCL